MNSPKNTIRKDLIKRYLEREIAKIIRDVAEEQIKIIDEDIHFLEMTDMKLGVEETPAP